MSVKPPVFDKYLGIESLFDAESGSSADSLEAPVLPTMDVTSKADRVRIISDGTAQGTKVLDSSGKLIPCVSAVSIQLSPFESGCFAHVKITAPELDVTLPSLITTSLPVSSETLDILLASLQPYLESVLNHPVYKDDPLVKKAIARLQPLNYDIAIFAIPFDIHAKAALYRWLTRLAGKIKSLSTADASMDSGQ